MVLPDGVALAVRAGERLFLGARRQLGRLRPLVVLARDRVLELAHPPAQGLAHLGEALRAEDEEDDDQQDRELPGSDPTWHATSIAAFSRGGLSARRGGEGS